MESTPPCRWKPSAASWSPKWATRSWLSFVLPSSQPCTCTLLFSAQLAACLLALCRDQAEARGQGNGAVCAIDARLAAHRLHHNRLAGLC